MGRAPWLLGLACLALGAASRVPVEQPVSKGERVDLLDAAWPGRAISYSGYRAGHDPQEGVYPSEEEVLEDLRILARHWRLLRIYSADRHSEDVLRLIRREGLDLSVMLGVWLAREPGKEEQNAAQVEAGIRLAREYEDVVVAVNVGNEVRVEWTEHPVPEASLVRYVRRVRAAVAQPVTVADNYVWWREHGQDLAREVDFITMHSYPIWERRGIEESLSYTIENYEGVRAAHPGRRIVIGEAGWATYTEGNLHLARAGDEASQARYFNELEAWAREERVAVFWFEAFDEPWKGSGTEGHWGLFTADRKAKLAMREFYPELATDAPTSPSYPEHIKPSGPELSVAFRAELARSLPEGSVNPLGPGLERYEVLTLDHAEGGRALRLEMNGESWGGVYFALGRHDASGARALGLRLELPAGTSSLELKLEDTDASAATVDLMRHAGEVDEHGWTTFSVPLSEFTGVELSRLALVGLWNPSDSDGRWVVGDLVIDDVHLE